MSLRGKMMKDIKKIVNKFIAYADKYLELNKNDEIFVKNRVLEILSKSTGEKLTLEERDEIFSTLSLMPSKIQEKFSSLLATDGKAAMDWFYNYCVHNDYVKLSQLNKNPRFNRDGLIITINKAKPEFKNPQKAKQENSVEGGFAECVICRENEGFGLRNKRNLRTVEITLGGEKWFWQFSPYGYFKEHGIAVNCKHIPMHIDKTTFINLMDFVDLFPHYFIGSNAALPRIGGSVLAHDHYQGGREILPMHQATAAYTLYHKDYPDIIAEVVSWNGSVIRLVSKNRNSISALSEIIFNAWINYENVELGIIAKDDEGFHNAISPTLRKTERGYEMHIILRNNVVSKEFPDGVFHAHPQYHMIKKESIGLIEAQGLFILPGRLEKQLNYLEELIKNNIALPKEYAEFKMVYDHVKIMKGDVHEAMQNEIARICNCILKDTAVFKDKKQMVNFLIDLGFNL